MIIILYPEDLPEDFRGNKKKPKLNDFIGPGAIRMGSMLMKPLDVVLYSYEGETIILKEPEETNT
jgi:hypothetical protein